MAVLHGSVIVEEVPTGREVSVKSGEGVQMADYQKIPKPAAYPWVKEIDWNRIVQHVPVLAIGSKIKKFNRITATKQNEPKALEPKQPKVNNNIGDKTKKEPILSPFFNTKINDIFKELEQVKENIKKHNQALEEIE